MIVLREMVVLLREGDSAEREMVVVLLKDECGSDEKEFDSTESVIRLLRKGVLLLREGDSAERGSASAE